MGQQFVYPRVYKADESRFKHDSTSKRFDNTQKKKVLSY